MSSGQQGANASGIFKWQWHGGQGESSLRKGLLNDVPPEIELAEYQRLSSAGSDSPSGLLNGESLKVEPIADLDLFFERLYNYYCEKGLWCIITKWIVELLSLGFTICFSGFFLLFVDWHGLRNAKCGIDAVESGIKPCDLARDALHRHPLVPFTFSKGIVIGYLGIFTIYWVFCFLRFFAQLKDTLKIRDFYYNSLNVTDHEIQTTPWAEILEKVVHIQRSQQLCVVKDLSELDVVMRIMRKDNYLIGMLNKGVLAFPIPRWVPGAGPAVISGANGRKNHLILTKTLEWTLNWCILQSMFDRNFSIRADFVSNPSSLKKRLIAVGLVMLLISPFLVIFMLVYFFLRHAEQFYNHPSTASSRRWSNLSKWIFREFNEVDHLFRHRINASVVHAADYIKQFPSPIVSLIAKFISFVAGGFAAILIIIALLDESLLEAHIFGRNLLWYAAIFGTVTAISRAAITDEFQVLDPEGAMSVVVQHTHYMPKRWRGKENTDLVRTEFEALFQYTGIMLLEEMASIFLTPCLLFFFVPKRVDDILQFISDFTVEIQGVGHVCSLSAFDFERHGNSNYGSPYSTSRERRSSQGKMEKSFLGFQSSYRTWEPDTQGKQFQSTMRDFRKQMQRQESQRSPTRTWQENQALRNTGEFHRSLSRDEWGQPRSSSPYSVNIGRKNYMFLLDWVYTTRVLHPMDPREAPDSPSQLLEEPRDNFWMPYDVGPEPGNDKWGFSFEDEERLGRSQLEASTSSPFFRDSLFRRHHRDVSQPGAPTESHWWARTGPQSSAVQNSFIEPPNFGRQHDFDHPCDSISEEHAVGGLDFRNSSTLFKSGYIDGDGDHEEDGGFNLPFHDIYNTPPRVESSLTRSERMNDELNVVIDRGLDFK